MGVYLKLYFFLCFMLSLLMSHSCFVIYVAYEKFYIPYLICHFPILQIDKPKPSQQIILLTYSGSVLLNFPTSFLNLLQFFSPTVKCGDTVHKSFLCVYCPHLNVHPTWSFQIWCYFRFSVPISSLYRICCSFAYSLVYRLVVELNEDVDLICLICYCTLNLEHSAWHVILTK